MKNHLVSVYLTTKNRPGFLDRALNSVKNQTYKNIEVLVCNDGSDPCFENEYNAVVRKYEDAFVRFLYKKNLESQGACSSRNYLIENAGGYFVTGLDDDDFFHKQRISSFLENYDDKYGFICANSTHDQRLFTNVDGGHEITFENMKFSNKVGNQIFIRKDRIRSVGGFDEAMPAWQDYDAWFRLLEIYGVAYKLKSRTMFVDVDPLRTRISTTSNAYGGYLKFIAKHKALLTDEHLISLKYNDLINRKQRFSLFKSDLLLRPKMFAAVFKNRSAYYYPRVYKLYRVFSK
ncbi:glycosyltransferase [Siccibacter turicensis]|uniref:glycosyltransferase n=1 Tax=Siccibacter turicensis TaxID=357233 RepID=UPI002A6B7E02|nr:glycosyltransferase [Siccibacter turicensis]MDY0973030.1 glycosyltransferase [Siccibacter turicensis]